MKLRGLIFAAGILVSLLSVSAGFVQDGSGEPAGQAKRGKPTHSAEVEMSSSKDTRIDLTPPKDDAKNHPNSAMVITDPDDDPSDVEEMHSWDPHKAAKDIEIGDYYFKRKNYRGAQERYKEALVYKPNDAVANFRLAACEEKLGQSTDAVQHYEAYLKVLPNGPFAADAQKALERLKVAGPKANVTTP